MSPPAAHHAGVAQLVERLLAKQKVEGSSPFSRSTRDKSVCPYSLRAEYLGRLAQ